MGVSVSTNSRQVEGYFLETVSTMLKSGYAIKDFSPNMLSVVFRTKNGDLTVVSATSRTQILFKGLGVNPNVLRDTESELTLRVPSSDMVSILQVLNVTKPPTGLDNVSAITLFMLGQQRSPYLIAVSKEGSLVELLARNKVRTFQKAGIETKLHVFKILNPTDRFSFDGSKPIGIDYRGIEMYYSRLVDLLTGVTMTASK